MLLYRQIAIQMQLEELYIQDFVSLTMVNSIQIQGRLSSHTSWGVTGKNAALQARSIANKEYPITLKISQKCHKSTWLGRGLKDSLLLQTSIHRKGQCKTHIIKHRHNCWLHYPEKSAAAEHLLTSYSMFQRDKDSSLNSALWDTAAVLGNDWDTQALLINLA